MNIPNIYNDPILMRKRRGNEIDPFKTLKETIYIEKGYALLSEIPNRYSKVRVSGLGREFFEVEYDYLTKDTFKVDYTNGIVYFHESLVGRSLDFEYLGEGVYLFPDSRVYLTGDKNFPNARDKFFDIDRGILVQKHRVDELIRSTPQPSEVVDMRVDFNGKIFPVSKDRIDAEQKKIEDAYVDAKGKRFDSLKLRIDSLQLATEESFDDQSKENAKLWSEINLVPGKISLESGRLEKKFDGRTDLLTAELELVPEKISLKVQELREWADGKFSDSYSEIDLLSDELNLKVSVDGVISSINLNKEGVRIKGSVLHLDGETRIDNGVIKSAMIENLDADKIKAGTIDAGRVKIHGGDSTDYTRIEGSLLESRGRFTRTWFGETNSHSVALRFENGYMRARNSTENRSLYFSDFGISTFIRGYDDEEADFENVGSGTIEFFSHMFDPNARGMSLFSNRGTIGIKTATRDIILDSYRNIRIEAGNLINIPGTGFRTQAIGVPEPYTNMYLGVSGERDGELRITNKAFYNGGDTRYLDVRARDYRGRRFIDTESSSYIYLGSDLGIRVTSKGANSNDPIIFRPVQASDFQVRSSRESKENIEKVSNGLDTVNKLNIVSFKYKQSDEERVGFIAEDSEDISKDDKGFISLSDTVAYNSLAIQELDKKYQNELNALKDEISSLKILIK